MDEMSYRKAKKEDLKEISEIFEKESAKKPYFQKWNEKTALRNIMGLFDKEDIHVAVINKKIVGFIVSGIKERKAFVEEFWIRSDYQGKGIGKTLLKFIEDEYRKKGVIAIGLVANQKAGTVHFYKKSGYKTKQRLLYMDKELKNQ